MGDCKILEDHRVWSIIVKASYCIFQSTFLWIRKHQEVKQRCKMVGGNNPAHQQLHCTRLCTCSVKLQLFKKYFPDTFKVICVKLYIYHISVITHKIILNVDHSKTEKKSTKVKFFVVTWCLLWNDKGVTKRTFSCLCIYLSIWSEIIIDKTVRIWFSSVLNVADTRNCATKYFLFIKCSLC